jgi:hypothetical protein
MYRGSDNTSLTNECVPYVASKLKLQKGSPPITTVATTKTEGIIGHDEEEHEKAYYTVIAAAITITILIGVSILFETVCTDHSKS